MLLMNWIKNTLFSNNSSISAVKPKDSEDAPLLNEKNDNVDLESNDNVIGSDGQYLTEKEGSFLTNDYSFMLPGGCEISRSGDDIIYAEDCISRDSFIRKIETGLYLIHGFVDDPNEFKNVNFLADIDVTVFSHDTAILVHKNSDFFRFLDNLSIGYKIRKILKDIDALIPKTMGITDNFILREVFVKIHVDKEELLSKFPKTFSNYSAVIEQINREYRIKEGQIRMNFKRIDVNSNTNMNSDIYKTHLPENNLINPGNNVVLRKNHADVPPNYISSDLNHDTTQVVIIGPPKSNNSMLNLHNKEP